MTEGARSVGNRFGEARQRLGEGARRDLVAIAVVALAVVTVTVLSTVLLPVRAKSPDLLVGRPWWEGWVNWDSGWYRQIALYGYDYTPGRQGPVAFFPLYPMLMRVGRSLVGSVTGSGVVVTLASGVAAAVLVARWFRERLSPDAAWTALLLFLLYPYSFYLFGPLYADALFLLAVIGSFTALERGHPWLAGLIGAAATASRPLGVVLVVGLVVRTLERRGVFGGRLARPVGQTPPRTPAERGGGGRPPDQTGEPSQAAPRWQERLARLRPGDCGVLLAAAGAAGYAFYLWHRFGDPLAFLTIQKAWGQEEGPVTWFKVDFFREMARFESVNACVVLAANAAVTLVAVALLPRVVRRFGWGYGTFTILIVALSGLSTKNFTGMGRYLLAAFPCFAVAGELLAERVRLRGWVLACSGVGLLAAASLFARAYYLS
jgi:hypothetical protein